MKKLIFILSLFLFLNSFSQSIRKSFTELTATEQAELVNALYAMRDINGDGNADPNPDDDDLFLDLATFHSDFFDIDRNNDANQDIHFNLSTQINIQIFMAWHRYQMYEMEHALQKVNPKLSIPYWNSSVDTVKVTLQNTLFSSDLLGPFNTDWGLNRNLGGISDALPTPVLLASIESMTEFANSNAPNDGGFTNQIERKAPHSGAHRWVNGAMASTASPSDPIFYFHHSWIDKIWDEWETANSGASSFIIQSMIRYDGTYSFNGQILPLINPNDITNSNSSLGVFYAENQLAQMQNYSVTNNLNTTETFYYQFTIEAGNNFIVPNGNNCNIESVSMVVLKPGFTAENGATLIAKIDTDNDINTEARINDFASTENRYNPFKIDNVRYGVYEPEYIERGPKKEIEILNSQIFPNPFKNKFTLTLDKKINAFKIEIFDQIGKKVFTKNYSNTNKVEIGNLEFLSIGNYLLKVSSDDGIILNSKILKI